MKERMETLAKIFEKLGLSPERFRVKYVLVAEGVKFADPVRMRTEQMEGWRRIELRQKMRNYDQHSRGCFLKGSNLANNLEIMFRSEITSRYADVLYLKVPFC